MAEASTPDSHWPQTHVRLHIISPALPPQLDGIGDYTARIAAELAESNEITVLTDRDTNHDPIPGVAIEPCFSPSSRRSVRALLTHARERAPDWLLLEYNPFAYGRWGLNLYLPVVINSIRRQLPRTRVAIMFHEVFTPVIDVRFAVMTTWQRAQLIALGRSADCLFFSVEAWTRQFACWFPGKHLTHLPVGSNVPRVNIGKEEARARLGIDPEAVVLGLFGTAHPSRMLKLTHQSAQAVLSAGHDAVVLYVGPDRPVIQREFGATPLIASAGAVEPAEVSRRFSAMDIHLAAFADGISTRRGTLMTGLQHGVATVGTHGRMTDSVLRRADGEALLLAPVDSAERFHDCVLRLTGDRDLRESVGAGAHELYSREFDWINIARQLIDALARCEKSASAKL